MATETKHSVFIPPPPGSKFQDVVRVLAVSWCAVLCYYIATQEIPKKVEQVGDISSVEEEEAVRVEKKE